MSIKSVSEEISSDLIDKICSRLAAGGSVRETLPGGGLIAMDRFRPFLCVYRHISKRADPGTQAFVEGEASYLSLPGNQPSISGVRKLIRELAKLALERFGSFFIIELWAAPDDQMPREKHAETGEMLLPGPRFQIHERSPERPGPSVNEMVFALERLNLNDQDAVVDVLLKGIAHPPGSQQLMPTLEGRKINCFTVGLEIWPIYRDTETGEVFPELLRKMQIGVGQALHRAFFTFSLRRTNTKPQNYFALGSSTLPRLVWKIDRQLSDIGGRFKFLLQVTPINAESAWKEFEESKFSQEPQFNYRPLSDDPLLLKRSVNQVATERVPDATMAHLLRQTQDELDRMITMMGDIGTDRFLPGSLQVFGGVDARLLELAEQMLKVPKSRSTGKPEEPALKAKAFARRAEKAIESYRSQHAAFTGVAEIRDDMYSGLMVTSGNLLIGRETTIPHGRVDALLAHEVGTHMVTYYNGQAQPLKLLSTGLAGYDSLQEGLAVLAEFLVGGLSRGRLRLLAARVIAVHMMAHGAKFCETWKCLTDGYKFEKRTAWTITMRVFRGGGLTKDAVYLRGLVEMLEYLGTGGELEPLFLGKLAVDHLPIVRELRAREVIKPAVLTPHYMSHPLAQERIEQAKRGLTVLDLFPRE